MYTDIHGPQKMEPAKSEPKFGSPNMYKTFTSASVVLLV